MTALVDCGWLEQHLDDPDVVVLEVDEHPMVYDIGHVPGAHRIAWRTDLLDDVQRDFVDAARLGRLLGSLGATPRSTIVLYGDSANWWATYAFWLLRLFGVERLRLLDGGRDLWVAQERPLSTDEPARRTGAVLALPERDDSSLRIFRDEVAQFVERARGPLVDVRSPAEYAGEVTHLAGHPQEGALRAGHIPGAVNVPWKLAVRADGTFRSTEQLRDLYARASVTGSEPVVTYCRIGERSSHTWFVLTQLLGLERVRNYDGSWTEWGNLVRAPIEVGT